MSSTVSLRVGICLTLAVLPSAQAQKTPGYNNEKHNLDTNADGSVDLYFGPKAPKEHESNWIETVPGKGWMILIRLYGPLEPWFDKTWQPGEIELLK